MTSTATLGTEAAADTCSGPQAAPDRTRLPISLTCALSPGSSGDSRGSDAGARTSTALSILSGAARAVPDTTTLAATAAT